MIGSNREPPFPVERNGTVYTIWQDGGTTLGLGFFGFIAGMGLAVLGGVLCGERDRLPRSPVA
ncbi:hypothetical protein [Haloarcula montana]|uniref:hypothetical protein n=1 Tax=Haloarcula montana TaxID=3111776 RepID=UPI002D7A22D7|nr:hypothetical protein [Haloarcula sp. GH36]